MVTAPAGHDSHTVMARVAGQPAAAVLTLTHQTDPQRWAVAHLRVHADLLVFSPATALAAPPRDGRRDGGEQRG